MVEAATSEKPVLAERAIPVAHEGADKHFFGLKQDGRHLNSQPVFTDDYERRLPSDPMYQETGHNARVWRAYNEEAAAFDGVMVGQSRDGLDVMLVFAGLFSAVVTSFLVQASQRLQADFVEMSAVLLYELVSVQQSISNGLPVGNISAFTPTPARKFEPDTIDVWINGLWAVSLTCSLVVALAAVLIKQWLHHYASLPSGTPGLRSHVRQFRFKGMEQWRVRIIVGMLPLIMHISLALFLIGLILFFIPLRLSIAYALATISVLACVLYLISNIMPIFYPQCPYQTPLTDFLFFLYRLFSASSVKSLRSMAVLETARVHLLYDQLSVDGMDWLFGSSSNPSIHSIVIQAVGGLPLHMRKYAEETWHQHHVVRFERDQLLASIVGPKPSIEEVTSEYADTLERLYRSFLFIPGFFTNITLFTTNPQLKAISWAVRRNLGEDERASFLEFLVSHHQTRLHPLIWPKLLQLGARSGTFGRLGDLEPDLSSYYARLISIFLRCTTGTIVSSFADRPSTFSEAIDRQSLHDTLTTFLRVMLSRFDPIPSKSTRPDMISREFIAAGHFVTSQLAPMTSGSEFKVQANLELLDEVLGYFFRAISRTKAQPDDFFSEYLRDLVLAVIEHTSICDYELPASDSAPGLNRIHYYTLYLYHQLFKPVPSSVLVPNSSFPCLHRVLVPMYYYVLSEDPTILSQLLFAKNQTILSLSLQAGREEAFRIFTDDNWFRILSEVHPPARLVTHSEIGTMIEHYIQGLSAMGPSADIWQEMVEHLHEPRNLILAFLMLADIVPARPRHSFSPLSLIEARTTELVTVCPNHPSWTACRATINALLSWSQSPDRETAEFPLENFFDGKTIISYTIDNRKSEIVYGDFVEFSFQPLSLDNDLQAIFAADHTEQAFEVALEILDQYIVIHKEE